MGNRNGTIDLSRGLDAAAAAEKKLLLLCGKGLRAGNWCPAWLGAAGMGSEGPGGVTFQVFGWMNQAGLSRLLWVRV